MAHRPWTEPLYMFTDPDAQVPFARHPTYGFRCMKADRPEDLSASLTAIIELPSRDLRNAKPVGEPIFQAWPACTPSTTGSSM